MIKVRTRIKRSKSKKYFEESFYDEKNQHVIPYKGKLAVKGEGNKRNTGIVETQIEAIGIAKKIATNQKSEVVIRNREGKIRDKDSYGNDHYPPKDKKY